MPDTTEPTAIITRLIATAVPAPMLLATVARRFPDLERKEFVAALQDATAAAERQATRRH